MNASAQLAGVTVTPAPESMDASYRTQISMLGVPAASLSITEVLGSSSGQHSGRLIPYSQGDGASFVPDLSFTQGETVTVRALVKHRERIDAVLLAVHGCRRGPVSRSLETPPPPPPPPKASEFQHFLSRPDLQPPTVSVRRTPRWPPRKTSSWRRMRGRGSMGR